MEIPVEEFDVIFNEEKDEVKKVDLAVDYIWFNSDLFPAECGKILTKTRQLAEQLNYEKGLAYTDVLLAYRKLNSIPNEEKEVYILFIKALEVFIRIGDTTGEARCLNMLSYGNWWQGKYEIALDQAYRSLKLAEEDQGPGRFEGLAWTNFSLGVFHSDLKDYSSSEKFFLEGLKAISKSARQNNYFTARSNSGLGTLYLNTGNIDKALEHIWLSFESYNTLNHEIGASRALNDLGVIERTKGNYQESEKRLLEALKLREDTKFKQGITTTLIELGILYIAMKRFYEAGKNLELALSLAVEINSQPKIFAAHQHLAELYKETEEPWKVVEHLEKFYAIKSSVVGEQASNKVKNLQTQFATEKSEKEAEIHRLKNVELKEANMQIEMKNKDILDSINYAKKIQQAILPDSGEIQNAFSDSFILYKPKDVVSGDFYWFSERNGKKIIAAVDCTGHGVPGAFMSMIGSALLNEVVNDKNISDPGNILDSLREGVIRSLKQTGAEGENKDGMDISLCVIEGNTVEFAGANNPLWFISKKGFQEIKGDKQPIGIYTDNKPFNTKKIVLDKNDCIYIFTDGYADQFGGEKGKKFKYRQLKDKLEEIATRPMSEQKNILDNLFIEWKGNHEQVDDVLVIGIRMK